MHGGRGWIRAAAAVGMGAAGALVLATASPASHVVTITSGPQGETAARSATFEWSSSESAAAFRCSLDGAASTACGSGTGGSITYTDLVAGGHRFQVTASIRSPLHGSSAERSWTVVDPTPTPTPTPDPTATPAPEPPPRIVRGVADAVAQPEVLWGGAVFSPSEMLARRLPKLSPVREESEEEENEEAEDFVRPVPVIPSCVELCVEAFGTRTPRPTSGPVVVDTSQIDPQIAASRTHLVLVNYNTMRVLGKDAQSLEALSGGGALPEVFDLRAVFHDLFDPGPKSVNVGLNLPPTLRCDASVNAFDVEAGTVTKAPDGDAVGPDDVEDCLMDIYDARVAFDSWRKRFVLIALVRNGGPGPTYMNTKYTVQERVGRRTRVLIAYSKGQDPRDGWHLSWINGEWGLGECNDVGTAPVDPLPRCPQGHLRPGDAVDYPLLGVSADGVQLALNIVYRSPWAGADANGNIAQNPSAGYQRLVHLPAKPLTKKTGGKASGVSWNDFSVTFDGAKHRLALYQGTGPVRQHAPADTGSAMWLAPFPAAGRLVLLEHREDEAYGPLRFTALTVKPFGGPGGSRPFAAMSGFIHSAVQRLGDLTATFGTCADWQDAPDDCTAAIRVVRFPLSLAEDDVVTWDRTFGRSNGYDDPPAGLDHVPYGWPAVDVTPLGDAVISYNRAKDPGLPLEARYSVWRALEPDLLSSRRLKAGEGGCQDVFLHDATSAAEPPPSAARGDEAGVWVYNAFGVAGGGCKYRYAVAKVLGKASADLDYLKVFGKARGPANLVVVKLANNGDRRSRRGMLRWSLTRRGEASAAAAAARRDRVRLPAVGAGRARKVRLRLRRVPAGRYVLRLRAAGTGREYSRANNRFKGIVRVG